MLDIFVKHIQLFQTILNHNKKLTHEKNMPDLFVIHYNADYFFL
jgi:hypothetical protein